MQYGDSRIGSISLGDWALDFFETSGPEGYLASSVEISRHDLRKARLTLVRPNVEMVEVIAQLRERARRWIADYETRHGADTTGFGDL